ncbi:zf-HC2 domain-containing protein [Asanoa siamensis]|uniref:Putative zinc-finger domain-containing protein n=1 Tax=Asanoa siamensis TaxID=926357 RepID=A0ABQ4CZ65_9ACTN|nr:zf-HC2 domain-containing protein [Asanoa siamensis]GIF76147.1 hypothetical protein Asi02nite_56650 [Asanoa siamensis]
MTHPVDALPAYTAGTLSPPMAADIADHLRGCASCRADAASWSALATGIRAATPTLAAMDPPPFAAVRARLVASAPPVAPAYRPAAAAGRWSAPVRVAWGLLTRQVRLVGWRVWAVAIMVIGGGAAFAGSAPPGRAGELLSLVIPLVAAVSVAAACGADGEAVELVRSTPTSTRVLVLARLTLVLAVTVGVGALASTAMAWPRGDLLLAELFLTWFGPLVPLSALSFTLAVLWRPEAGAAVVLGCWILRLLAPTALLDRGLSTVLDAVWRPGVPMVVGAVALTLVVVGLAPLANRRVVRPAALS